MELHGIKILKAGDRAFLEIGEYTFDLEDYEFINSVQSGTKVKFTLAFKDELTELSSLAKKESFQLLRSKSMNDAP